MPFPHGRLCSRLSHDTTQHNTIPPGRRCSGLHNKTIHAKLWRFAWKDMPATREGRIEWLYERWADMDAWVAQQKAREEEEEEKEEVSPPRASRRHHKSE